MSKYSAIKWIVAAPLGLMISGVYAPQMYSQGLNDGAGWYGGFIFKGGSGGYDTTDGETGWSSSAANGLGYSWPAGGTPWFGWKVVCGFTTCSNGGAQWLSVEELELNVTETVAAAITGGDGLWDASGWVRGDWPLTVSGDSPSGICSASVSLAAQAVPGGMFSFTHDSSYWHQCGTAGNGSAVGGAASAGPLIVHTADPVYGNGSLTLQITGADAAGEQAAATKTLEVDNLPVSVALAGPSSASTTAGTQYVDAVASAGPSGVAGIACSLDGGPFVWQPTASTRIAVQGAGSHQVSCYAQNNALDVNGAAARSSTETWSLSIQEPTVSTVSFARVADSLRCIRTRKHIRLPAQWVTERYQGHRVRVRVPPQKRTITVIKCHPHIRVVRVRVGKRWVAERLVMLPHMVATSRTTSRFGDRTRINGWLGTAEGNALAGQPVDVLTAPDTGLDQYQVAVAAITGANGDWSAALPPGPSRLVEAAYAGTSSLGSSVSAPVRIVVPASVRLSVRPRRTNWGRTIVISGRLAGGYVPPSGELVVLWIGWNGGSAEIGHLYAKADGSFRTTYTFLRGNGTEHYRLWASSARETDYPYSPSASAPVPVTVGP
ncbi:MAG: hypothetical protein ACYC91_03985 [Solirubrobacteraceae bacterium]